MNLMLVFLVSFYGLLMILNSIIEIRLLNYYYLISSFFVPPILLTLLLPGKPVGINAGGSPLYNLLFLGLQFGFFLLFFTNKETIKRESIPSSYKNQEIISMIVNGSIFSLSLLELGSALTGATPIFPTVQALLFCWVVLLTFRGYINFRQLIDAYLNFSLTFMFVILVSILVNFKWSQSNLDFTLYSSDIYISPLGSLFGISVHNGGPFGAPNDLGIFCAYTFMLASLFLDQKPLKRNILLILSAVTGSLSGSRTFYLLIFVSIMLGIFRYLFHDSAHIQTKFAGSIIAVVFCISFAQFLSSILVKKAGNVENLSGRRVLWKLILEKWSSNGLFGHGPNTLRDYMINYTWETAYGHAHNTFLRYLWDWGILGILLIFAFLFGLLLFFGKHNDTNSRLFYFLVVLLTLQSEISINFSQTMLGFFPILLLSGAKAQNQKPNERKYD